MAKVRAFVLHGPNLNLLGVREPAVYGQESYEQMMQRISLWAEQLDIELGYAQTNSEGELIDYLQAAMGQFDFIIINPGAFTHTSYALRDALVATGLPVIEVHLSNIFAREEWRAKSVISKICHGFIGGMGAVGYYLALQAGKAMIDMLSLSQPEATAQQEAAPQQIAPENYVAASASTVVAQPAPEVLADVDEKLRAWLDNDQLASQQIAAAAAAASATPVAAYTAPAPHPVSPTPVAAVPTAPPVTPEAVPVASPASVVNSIPLSQAAEAFVTVSEHSAAPPVTEVASATMALPAAPPVWDSSDTWGLRDKPLPKALELPIRSKSTEVALLKDEAPSKTAPKSANTETRQHLPLKTLALPIKSRASAEAMPPEASNNDNEVVHAEPVFLRDKGGRSSSKKSSSQDNSSASQENTAEDADGADKPPADTLVEESASSVESSLDNSESVQNDSYLSPEVTDNREDAAEESSPEAVAAELAETEQAEVKSAEDEPVAAELAETEQAEVKSAEDEPVAAELAEIEQVEVKSAETEQVAAELAGENDEPEADEEVTSLEAQEDAEPDSNENLPDDNRGRRGKNGSGKNQRGKGKWGSKIGKWFGGKK